MSKERTRIYREGDAMGRLIHDLHGKSSRHYGRWGHQYHYTLYVYKGNPDEGYQFAMSLAGGVRIAYVRAVIKAVAETPMPLRWVSNVYWWLEGKTWKYTTRRGSEHEYPLIRG